MQMAMHIAATKRIQSGILCCIRFVHALPGRF